MNSPRIEENHQVSPADWDEIHQIVQDIFAGMGERIHQRWPRILSQGGRTSAKVFALFSYRVFSLANQNGTDPVVVGVDFKPADNVIEITGDICGEESGRVYHELAPRKVSKKKTIIFQAAQEVAQDLAAQVDCVAAALNIERLVDRVS